MITVETLKQNDDLAVVNAEYVQLAFGFAAGCMRDLYVRYAFMDKVCLHKLFDSYYCDAGEVVVSYKQLVAAYEFIKDNISPEDLAFMQLHFPINAEKH